MYLDAALLLLRVAIGGVVIPHGLLKLGLVGKGGSLAGVGGGFNSMGLRPGLFWAYVAVLSQAGGGLPPGLRAGGPPGAPGLPRALVLLLIGPHLPPGVLARGGHVRG